MAASHRVAITLRVGQLLCFSSTRPAARAATPPYDPHIWGAGEDAHDWPQPQEVEEVDFFEGGPPNTGIENIGFLESTGPSLEGGRGGAEFHFFHFGYRGSTADHRLAVFAASRSPHPCRWMADH